MESEESLQQSSSIFDLTKEYNEYFPRPSLIATGASIGADAQSYGELLRLTYDDHVERGFTVRGNGRIKRSGIIEGENFVEMEGQEVSRISIPLIAGLRGPDVFVHTHYIPADLHYIETSTLSPEDIDSYVVHSTLKTLVMIDRGGTHVLTRRKQQAYQKTGDPFYTPDGKTIIDTAFAKTEKSQNSSRELRMFIAQQLAEKGYFYYYSPELTPQEDGSMQFQYAGLESTP